jgi:hypothetical protein
MGMLELKLESCWVELGESFQEWLSFHTCMGEMIFPHRCVVGVIVPRRCQVACWSTHKQVKVHGCVQNLNNCTSKLQTDYVRTCRHSLLVYTKIKNYLYRCLNRVNLSTQSCLDIWNLYRQQAICWAIYSMDSTSVGRFFEFLKNHQFSLFEKK